MGSIAPWPDFSSGWNPLLPDQIFIRGGIHQDIDRNLLLYDQIYLRGGICQFSKQKIIAPYSIIYWVFFILFYKSCQCRRSLNKVCSCCLKNSTSELEEDCIFSISNPICFSVPGRCISWPSWRSSCCPPSSRSSLSLRTGPGARGRRTWSRCGQGWPALGKEKEAKITPLQCTVIYYTWTRFRCSFVKSWSSVSSLLWQKSIRRKFRIHFAQQKQLFLFGFCFGKSYE